jgi:hypothetical protein
VISSLWFSVPELKKSKGRIKKERCSNRREIETRKREEVGTMHPKVEVYVRLRQKKETDPGIPGLDSTQPREPLSNMSCTLNRSGSSICSIQPFLSNKMCMRSSIKMLVRCVSPKCELLIPQF